jgi:hypothetical protein
LLDERGKAMLVGLESEDGTRRLKWGEIDLIRDHAIFAPADPALIAYLMETQSARNGLDRDGVTASQAGKGIRQLWLEDEVDFYSRASSLLTALMGTIRHGTSLTGRDLFLTETRYSDDLGSAQIDSFFIPTGLLSDLKTIGWFKLKMILQNGIDPEGMSYVWQVNRQKYLLERNTEHRVKRMILMVVPPDLKGRAKEEAATMGVQSGMLQVDIPDMGEGATRAVYERLRDGKRAAKDSGHAPFCSKEDTWSGKRCQSDAWCPVRKACFNRSQIEGVRHPYLEKIS